MTSMTRERDEGAPTVNLRTVANAHPESGGGPWGWVEADGKHTRITWGGQAARDLLDEAFAAAPAASADSDGAGLPDTLGVANWPGGGGRPSKYDDATWVNDASGAWVLLYAPVQFYDGLRRRATPGDNGEERTPARNREHDDEGNHIADHPLGDNGEERTRP